MSISKNTAPKQSDHQSSSVANNVMQGAKSLPAVNFLSQNEELSNEAESSQLRNLTCKPANQLSQLKLKDSHSSAPASYGINPFKPVQGKINSRIAQNNPSFQRQPRQQLKTGPQSLPNVLQGMFWEKTPEGKYVWHYGPVIGEFWKKSDDEDYSDTPKGNKYGVWLRKSAIKPEKEQPKINDKETVKPTIDLPKKVVKETAKDSQPELTITTPPVKKTKGNSVSKTEKTAVTTPVKEKVEIPKSLPPVKKEGEVIPKPIEKSEKQIKKEKATERWKEINKKWAELENEQLQLLQGEINILMSGFDFIKTAEKFDVPASNNKPWDYAKYVASSFRSQFKTLQSSYQYPPTTTKNSTPPDELVNSNAVTAMAGRKALLDNETRRVGILKEAITADTNKLNMAKLKALVKKHFKSQTKETAFTNMSADIVIAAKRQFNMNNLNWISRIGHSIAKNFSDRRPVRLSKLNGEKENVNVHVSIYPDAKTNSSYIYQDSDTKEIIAKSFYTSGVSPGARIHTTLEQTGLDNSQFNAKYYAYAADAEKRGFDNSDFINDWDIAKAALKDPIDTRTGQAEVAMQKHLDAKGDIGLLRHSEEEWNEVHPGA